MNTFGELNRYLAAYEEQQDEAEAWQDRASRDYAENGEDANFIPEHLTTPAE